MSRGRSSRTAMGKTNRTDQRQRIAAASPSRRFPALQTFRSALRKPHFASRGISAAHQPTPQQQAPPPPPTDAERLGKLCSRSFEPAQLRALLARPPPSTAPPPLRLLPQAPASSWPRRGGRTSCASCGGAAQRRISGQRRRPQRGATQWGGRRFGSAPRSWGRTARRRSGGCGRSWSGRRT